MTYQSLMIFDRVRRYRSSLKNIGSQRRIKISSFSLKSRSQKPGGTKGGLPFPVANFLTSNRSSHPEVFLRKAVLKIHSKFTGEHTIEITLRHGCSPVNLLHISRTPFSRNTSWWLLLYYFFFIINDNKNKLKNLQTEIQYHLRKQSLNITSNISHNQTRISLYNGHQTTQ